MTRRLGRSVWSRSLCSIGVVTVAGLVAGVVGIAEPASASTTPWSVVIGAVASRGYGVALADGTIAFGADETTEGADLNGDGDASDLAVVHVWDGVSTRNLGLASGFGFLQALEDGGLAIGVSEVGQNADLNGDGVLTNLIVHVWDGTSLTNLGVESNGDVGVPVDGGGVAVRAHEYFEDADLNGDGDREDSVIKVWDGTVFMNLGVGITGSAYPVALDGGAVAFVASESRQDADLNGDGDAVDAVVHVWGGGSLIGLGVASNNLAADPVALTGGGLAFVADETAEGADLNDDGDASDFSVVHTWDGSSITNLGVVSYGIAVAMAGGGLEVGVHESGQDADLNGDGDVADVAVVHVWDGTAVSNVGVASSGRATALAMGGLAFAASERDQGSDLNGDGDETDSVVHVVHTVTVNLGVAVGGLDALEGGALAFTGVEPGQNADLNGDGDLTDRAVLHVWESASVVNLGAATASAAASVVSVDGGGVAFAMSESEQATDLNGDGDRTDNIVRARVQSGVVDLGAGGPSLLRLRGGGVAFFVSEADYGDRNGDGDISDFVAALARPGDTTPPTLMLPSSPIRVNATGPAGATVTFSVVATDDVTQHPEIGCTPPSGSVFPIGQTTVECIATDEANNAAPGSFAVVVAGPSAQLAELTSRVHALRLPGGLQTSLVAKLDGARAALRRGARVAACGSLGAFQHEVRAQRGKALTTTATVRLLSDATRIRAVIGCP